MHSIIIINIEILNNNNGPFLSTINAIIGPKINIQPSWNILRNCKAVPFIPKIAPNVLPVLIINDKGNPLKSWEKVSRQNLNVLVASLTFLFVFILLNFFAGEFSSKYINLIFSSISFSFFFLISSSKFTNLVFFVSSIISFVGPSFFSFYLFSLFLIFYLFYYYP